MKKLLMLVFGLAVALATPFAHADSLNQISFAGSASYAASSSGGESVTFNSYPGTTQNASVFGTSTGMFSAFTGQTYGTNASAGTVVTFNNFNTTQTNFVLFTATAPNGQTVSFTVTSLVASNSGGTPSLTGSGYYTFVTNGVTTTVPSGSFQMTTQGGANTNVSFSDTNTVTPEPSSLILLGTGLFSAAGMLVRRRRRVIA